MSSPEGGAYWFDQVRSIIKGGDPLVFFEWAEIIEKKSKEKCGDREARIIFGGAVDEEKRFSPDVDATDPDAIVCLLESIQSRLDLMPSVPKQFYAAIMEAILFQAQEKGKLDGPWRF